MKKLLKVVFTMLLAGSLAFAQTDSGGSTSKNDKGGTTTKTAKGGGKKGHTGSKKGKKMKPDTSCTGGACSDKLNKNPK